MLNSVATNPSIFLRLKQSDAAPREFAWKEFHARYAPIITAFAVRLGARQQDIDDVLQDVMLGFFSKSPTFVYDSGKGRFRGYLKVCTYRALATLVGKHARYQGVSLDQIDPQAVAIEHAWNEIWEQELYQRAMQEVRAQRGQTKTFLAFEQYVAHNQPAESVAASLELHLTSVYRAKREVTDMLREKIRAMNDED
ncbi:MAG: sigma-70 family RNA polymerase sigma factor [Anaerolineae bacterium]|nr:sigma-70 family RNA polymerase sigma factor [Phycisphaerae bacterium]